MDAGGGDEAQTTRNKRGDLEAGARRRRRAAQGYL
jgi:hypothetical protein